MGNQLESAVARGQLKESENLIAMRRIYCGIISTGMRFGLLTKFEVRGKSKSDVYPQYVGLHFSNPGRSEKRKVEIIPQLLGDDQKVSVINAVLGLSTPTFSANL